MWTESLTIFAITVVFGCLPVVFRPSHRWLHLLVAFATGLFLGVVFLHLLPSVAHSVVENEMAHEAEEQAANGEAPANGEEDPDHAEEEVHSAEHGHSHSWLWVFVLAGVVVVYLVENLLLHPVSHGHAGHSGHPGESGREHWQHVTLGYATFFGLAVHAFTSGIGLAATVDQPDLKSTFFVSIISHKGAESFSLTTIFLLAGFRVRKVLILLAAFSVVTPVGILLGSLWFHGVGQDAANILTALATGTFLFVALCDLLPEVFHHRAETGLKLVLLLAGIGLSAMIQL
ncbi:MAG: ZIP family metal transporter [Planctomycetota bacterium]